PVRHSFPTRRSSDLSIVMVVYGAATETSVGALFMAGVVPGIALGLLLMVAIYIVARIKNYPRQPRASIKEVLTAARDSIWGLARSEEHTSELQSREN